MNVGDKIRKLRSDRHWSQKELGDKIGRPQNSISQIENNIMPIDSDTIRLLSDVFQIEASYFVTDDEIEYSKYTKRASDIDKIINTPNDTDSFAILLIEKILRDKTIDDPNDIPQETVDMILSALRQDIKRVNSNNESNK